MRHKILVPFIFLKSLNISDFNKYVPIYALIMSGEQIFARQSHIKGEKYLWCTLYDVRDRFPMVSLEFLIEIILPAALWPWGRLGL
jgi:hypothetical protein